MAADSELDQSRAVVKTYVPAYQKEEWTRHADELGMSQSEFVRTMVQAGRQGFGADFDGPTAERDAESAIDGASNGAPPLEDDVLALLSTDEHRTWDVLLDELASGFEAQLERTLNSLETTGEVKRTPRGYALAEADER